MQKQYNYKPASKPAIKLAAVAAMLFSGAAMAQSSVTQYGQADMFVGGVKSPGNGDSGQLRPTACMDVLLGGSQGVEDLGMGTKAIFDLNGFFSTDTGSMGRINGDFDAQPQLAAVGLQNSLRPGQAAAATTTPYFALDDPAQSAQVDSYVFSPQIFHTYFTVNNGQLYDPGVIGDSAGTTRSSHSTPTFGGLIDQLLHLQPG